MNEPVETTTIHGQRATHERTLRAVTEDVLHELKEFIDTRLRMARAEFEETIQSLKMGVPLLLGAFAFVATGFLMLTVAAVAIVTVAFAGSLYAWFFSFLIVGVLWIALGAIAAFFVYNEFRSQGRFPKRTLQVLKADKLWLQNEARSH